MTAAELFDAIGAGYEDAFGRPPILAGAIRAITQRLRPGARVLDIGSGTGKPVAEELSRAGYEVVGLDVSAVMVELARERVPRATFQHADVRNWSSPPASWDAVCAFFPFLQMSRADTAATLHRVAGWLVPGGTLALVTVPMDVENLPVPFLGHQVRITSFATADLLHVIERAGLEVTATRSETFHPDRAGQPAEEHLLVLARNPEQ